MNQRDKLLIRYDGMYDLECIDLEDKVAFTSIKTKSSGAMIKEEFKEYKLYCQNLYYHNSVDEILQPKIEDISILDDINYHVTKQDLNLNVYGMFQAFSQQYKRTYTDYEKEHDPSQREKQFNCTLNWILDKIWSVVECKIQSEKVHKILKHEYNDYK